MDRCLRTNLFEENCQSTGAVGAGAVANTPSYILIVKKDIFLYATCHTSGLIS